MGDQTNSVRLVGNGIDRLPQVESKDKELAFVCNSDIPSKIPNGDLYELGYLRAEENYQWGRHKLYLWFQMTTPGEWFGQKFYMVCNVAQKDKWGPSSKYWMAWVLAAGRRPKRHDRMSTAVFKNKIFRVRMRVVLKTSKQLDRTSAQQYSVVDELLEVTVG